MAGRDKAKETAAAFNKENYESILVRVQKGTKAQWQDAADKEGVKLNRWIVSACTARMNGEGNEDGAVYGSATLKGLSQEAQDFVQKNPSIYHSVMAMVARIKGITADDEAVEAYMKKSGTKKFGLTDNDKPYVKEIMALCIEKTQEK